MNLSNKLLIPVLIFTLIIIVYLDYT
jgi:hypothetical protein